MQLEPDSPLCIARLAFILMLQQRWEEAVDAAHAALTAGRPAGSAARTNCGEVLANAGHAEEAVDAVRLALSFDPHSRPATRAVLGRALLLAGQPDAALPELRWCAARLPDYVPCQHSLVVAAVETGRMAEARAALREVLRLQPDWVPRNHTGQWFFRRDVDLARFRAAFAIAGMPGLE